jgi:hypothetical protein
MRELVEAIVMEAGRAMGGVSTRVFLGVMIRERMNQAQKDMRLAGMMPGTLSRAAYQMTKIQELSDLLVQHSERRVNWLVDTAEAFLENTDREGSARAESLDAWELENSKFCDYCGDEGAIPEPDPFAMETRNERRVVSICPDCHTMRVRET